MASNLRTWGYIHRVYRESSRGALRRNCFRFKNWKQSRLYWALTIVSVLLGLITFSLLPSYLGLFLVGSINLFIGVVISVLLERDVAKKYQSLYLANGISDYPYLVRPRYFHYVLFREKLVADGKIKPEDVDSLLRWGSIDQKKPKMNSIFESRLFLMFFGGMVAILSQQILKLNANLSVFVALFLVLCLILWLSYLFHDIRTSKEVYFLRIRQFLMWYEMEVDAVLRG